jgi:hypothetical protein
MSLRGQIGPQLGKTFFNKLLLYKKLLQNQQAISVKLDANYPYMKAIQVCLDKGTDPHQRGDNHKNANIG